MKDTLPNRTLRERPDLDQLRRQAKELLDAFRAGDSAAVADVRAYHGDIAAAAFALHDAQLVLARAYGFDSWPKLKAYVDGATVGRLVDAVRANDIGQVRAMLQARPELATMGIDNHQALHFAVVRREPQLVRLLMQHGADARAGVYPHRDATSALTIATERGYEEIVAIIRTEEQRRREAGSGQAGVPTPDALFAAIVSGDDARAIAMMQAQPAFIRTCNPEGWTPLHIAAGHLRDHLVGWLLEHGAPAIPRGPGDVTPLDLAAGQPWDQDRAVKFVPIAANLQRRGAALTARSAVAMGNIDWLGARHAAGTLSNPIEPAGGLLRIAVTHDRPEALRLLLDLGFDPDERHRLENMDEVVLSWGGPLWQCATRGRHEMAEMLLSRGADPNAQVYASGTPVYQAYGMRDWKMVELLRRYGGLADRTAAGLYRQTDLARQMLLHEGVGSPVAEGLLGDAACGGDPEIVRMALERVDWPREDPRWFGILEQPLRIWNHGSGHWANHEWDRGSYLTCFRLVLERCDPNIRGRGPDRGRFGLTILHSVAGSRPHVTPQERVGFATLLLDAGARLDVRDNLLLSTPLGWACRWGRIELVHLLLERGADPLEPDAEPWATPKAWAQKMGHADALAVLRQNGA